MHTVKELETLARRWMACRGFAWEVGMGTTAGDTVAGHTPQGAIIACDLTGAVSELDTADAVPDLRDRATEGVLYSALAARHPGLCIRRGPSGLWVVSAWEGGIERSLSSARSRIGALVAAWEAL